MKTDFVMPASIGDTDLANKRVIIIEPQNNGSVPGGEEEFFELSSAEVIEIYTMMLRRRVETLEKCNDSINKLLK
jgi:hypothetical protein